MLVLQLWSNRKIVELRAESWVSLMFSDSGDLWSSSDTSRCVAEKKYTEQQAKKLFPQVFVPVCNPDGTYSEVTGKPLTKTGACFEFIFIDQGSQNRNFHQLQTFTEKNPVVVLLKCSFV